jgi:hypothetical protein
VSLHVAVPLSERQRADAERIALAQFGVVSVRIHALSGPPPVDVIDVEYDERVFGSGTAAGAAGATTGAVGVRASNAGAAAASTGASSSLSTAGAVSPLSTSSSSSSWSSSDAAAALLAAADEPHFSLRALVRALEGSRLS